MDLDELESKLCALGFEQRIPRLSTGLPGSYRLRQWDKIIRVSFGWGRHHYEVFAPDGSTNLKNVLSVETSDFGELFDLAATMVGDEYISVV